MPQPFLRHLYTRRRFLQCTGAAGVWLAHFPRPLRLAHAAVPQSGGIARGRGYDPLGWDPMLTLSYRTHIALSDTHNHLVRYQASADTPSGTLNLIPDNVYCR